MAATNGRYAVLRATRALTDPRSIAFAECLRAQRRARKLTVNACARWVGMDQTFLSRLELAQRMPGRQVLERLVTVFDLSPAESDRWYWLAGFTPPSLEKLEEWPTWLTAACQAMAKEE